jgi:tRNA threonylcarbamoyladenosine biosynthesis protein TsaE
MSGKMLEMRLENIEQTAVEFLRTNSGYNKFAFYGAMGAGKTTFITALCKALKAIDLVSSPTFSIVNEYNTQDGNIIFHFDFYRIKNPEELYDIGFEEYCRNDAWCFIEWPERAEELIPDDFIKVYIEINETGKRLLTYNHLL